MQGIKLKDFQINTVNKLLDATSIGSKKEVLLQAPTGSGKTIILLSYIEEYLKENNKVIFVWLTPGKGDLEEQSRKKMVKFLPHHNTNNYHLPFSILSPIYEPMYLLDLILQYDVIGEFSHSYLLGFLL